AIMSRDGATMQTLGKPEGYEELRLSPDGRTLALTLRDAASFLRVWVMDMERGVSTPFSSDSTSAYPAWSPDGKEIAFASNRGGTWQMYRKSLAGSGPEQLIRPAEDWQLPRAWSKEGILYAHRQNERYEYSLLLLPLAPVSAPIPIASPVSG